MLLGDNTDSPTWTCTCMPTSTKQGDGAITWHHQPVLVP